MSGNIQCYVAGCDSRAEIEVQRGRDVIWVCSGHWKVFFAHSITTHNLTTSRDYFRKALKAARLKLKDAREEIADLLAEAEEGGRLATAEAKET